MFGNVEDYGETFQDSVFQTRGGSLSSTNQVRNPVAYKLVRVAGDGRLVPATDEEILEVKDLLENNENDMPILPDPILTEGYIADEGSPSQYLQLESLEGLFQSETAEAYTENLNARLESKEELMYGSQMHFTLPDTKFQISNELSGNEEQVQPEVFLQEPIRFSSNGCSMNQSMDVSPYSDATGSPKEPALSTAAPKPEFCRVAGEICLENLSIKALQETFRATFGRETTCKDKKWLKRRIRMGRNNSCVVPTTSLTINDNKLIGGGQDNYNDTINSFGKEDEERATNYKDTPSSPDCIKGNPNDLGYCPVETFVDHYSGNEDFEGEHRSAKRVRKPTRRYIEEISKTDEKQQSDESIVPSKDQRSIQAVSSGGRVVVTRMVSLAGSRIQVPYVSHVRRSRPRENILALGEFHSRSWEVEATPEESNLNLCPSQLNNDRNLVSGVKSASGPVKKENDKEHLKPIFAEVDQDIMIMEPERLDSSGDSSDDNNNSDLPIRQNAIRRKHHRAWTLSEVVKLVEGVSKYGVGKWSEIKKLSFSSHAYRTPVDLKDKWRNLRKASFAQTNSNQMGSVKKHGWMAVPSHILLKVRELAHKQSPAVSKARMLRGSRNQFL
ncbi:Telomere repeat-binding protein 4 [Cardamine amara subsp. amara]|uniref:Telomere repeat-binding protein 4 n=1 Tax=Cardamine amara subsp. amara TaxID=228776 RepID=A0ABD1C3S4_CARAN